MTWLDEEPSNGMKHSRMIRDTIAVLIREGGTTKHSAQGLTMGLIVRGLEEAKCPYQIMAWPGMGYSIVVERPMNRTSLPGVSSLHATAASAPTATAQST